MMLKEENTDADKTATENELEEIENSDEELMFQKELAKKYPL